MLSKNHVDKPYSKKPTVFRNMAVQLRLFGSSRPKSVKSTACVRKYRTLASVCNAGFGQPTLVEDLQKRLQLCRSLDIKQHILETGLHKAFRVNGKGERKGETDGMVVTCHKSQPYGLLKSAQHLNELIHIRKTIYYAAKIMIQEVIHLFQRIQRIQSTRRKRQEDIHKALQNRKAVRVNWVATLV
ncbi:hypothetical protein F2P81_010873 [Scophthalmus maximus]|uniref:Uncharacterized protein n=1 Tax=Scophthalmus maximus TaxID=52904 RepID=A0A6A4SZ47_SCOMX|nr:hypothetical protein F2P81_010873 [Scophthalmus maximus]